MARKKDDEGEPKGLSATILAIQKDFGELSIYQYSKAKTDRQVEFISTGSLALDYAFSGGVPRGLITVIYGPEGVGKSTVCGHVVANCQKMGLQAAYIDMENAFQGEYFETIGVDLSSLWFAQPDSGEQALEITERLARTGDFGAVVVDSIATLVPEKEIQEQMGSAPMASIARLTSQAMRKLSRPARASKTAILFTNQIRQKIGVFYGNPESVPGGMAPKYAASIYARLSRSEWMKDGERVYGLRSKIKVEKCKVGPPFREQAIEIVFGKGIDPYGELISMGVDYEVIDKRGAFFSYQDTRLGQGIDNSKEFLRLNQSLFDEIRGKVVKMIAAVSGGGMPMPEESEVEKGDPKE